MNKPILSCQQVNKSYHDGLTPIKVLKEINLYIKPGECVAIVGPSGSGKSTLLHLLGGLDNPTSGQVLLNDRNWQDLSEKERCRFRNSNLGFIYQFHHLLPEFTALENVALPLLLGNISLKQAKMQAKKILHQVGLANRLEHKPSQLSGGERQRVAIARALVHQPQCVLADEPTGNLDHATASSVFESMKSLNERFNAALIIVTHDTQLAAKMDRILIIKDGYLSTT